MWITKKGKNSSEIHALCAATSAWKEAKISIQLNWSVFKYFGGLSGRPQPRAQTLLTAHLTEPLTGPQLFEKILYLPKPVLKAHQSLAATSTNALSEKGRVENN